MQPENADQPIVATLPGIDTSVSPLQSTNASFAIRCTPAGTANDPVRPNGNITSSACRLS